MLGRTHMALGALGAVAAAPVVIHSGWEPMRQLLQGNWNTIPHVLVAQVILAIAMVIGSIMPDLDQPDSLMAHRVEFLGRIVVVAISVGGVVLMHQVTSLFAWAVVGLIALLFGGKGNDTRILGLALVMAGLLYLGWKQDIPIVAGVLLAAWCLGAILTAHRTFTHSLPGLIVFAVGVYLCTHGMSRLHLSEVPTGLIVGYALHMAADAVAGGVPLLWPWGQRFGVRLVKTGSPWDHMIGGLATLGFAALVIL